MSFLLDLLAALCLLAGLFFMLVSSLGIVRLPDTYLRLHAASKAATLGLMGLLLATVLHLGTAEVMLKSLLVVVFTFVANPIGSHLLAKAALRSGHEVWEGTCGDESAPPQNTPPSAG